MSRTFDDGDAWRTGGSRETARCQIIGGVEAAGGGSGANRAGRHAYRFQRMRSPMPRTCSHRHAACSGPKTRPTRPPRPKLRAATATPVSCRPCLTGWRTRSGRRSSTWRRGPAPETDPGPRRVAARGWLADRGDSFDYGRQAPDGADVGQLTGACIPTPHAQKTRPGSPRMGVGPSPRSRLPRKSKSDLPTRRCSPTSMALSTISRRPSALS